MHYIKGLVVSNTIKLMNKKLQVVHINTYCIKELYAMIIF